MPYGLLGVVLGIFGAGGVAVWFLLVTAPVTETSRDYGRALREGAALCGESEVSEWKFSPPEAGRLQTLITCADGRTFTYLHEEAGDGR